MEHLTPRTYWLGCALSNEVICSGHAPEWQLKAWFGDRTGIKREEICARQAIEHVEALLRALP